MKIRTCFVSNSSSSSFIIFGKELNWDEYMNDDTDKCVFMIGRMQSEGEDIFEITHDMKDIIKFSEDAKNSDIDKIALINKNNENAIIKRISQKIIKYGNYDSDDILSPKNKYTLIESFVTLNNENDLIKKEILECLPSQFKIFHREKAYYSCNSIWDFADKYIFENLSDCDSDSDD